MSSACTSIWDVEPDERSQGLESEDVGPWRHAGVRLSEVDAAPVAPPATIVLAAPLGAPAVAAVAADGLGEYVAW